MNVESRSTVPLAGLRAAIARKMAESLGATAQLTFHVDCDATELCLARDRWKSVGEAVGYDDLLLHALARVLRQFPRLNAIETQGGLELQPTVDVNYAVAVQERLITPVMRGLEDKTVLEIATTRRTLTDKARSGRLSVSDVIGGSFTFSSLGTTRVRYFTPILNHPQKAVLGIGHIERRPWIDARTDQVISANLLPLSLTVDHRWIDGHPAGEFLTTLCRTVETEIATPPGPGEAQ